MSTARKPGIIRRLSIGAALLGVAAAPVALAQPASAATTQRGCTVSPLTPVFAGFTPAGVKQVRHNVAIACFAGRTIEVQQMVMEEDTVPPTPDQFIVTRVNSFPTGGNGVVVIRGITENLPDTEPGAEEIYHKVRFRVTLNSTGVQGPWTTFEHSSSLSIAN